MESDSARSPKLRAALKKLGNPYACEQVYEITEQLKHSSIDAALHQYLHRSENPYASLGVEARPDEPVETARPINAKKIKGISKAEFRAAAQRIFRSYIPALENGALRQHHKDFISRNEIRSPEQRAAILAGLGKYDISSSGMSGQFNRERDDLTLSKLASIEEQALGTSQK